jgi:hypothetical protein
MTKRVEELPIIESKNLETKFNETLEIIKSTADLEKLPVRLINDCFRLADVLEKEGSLNSVRDAGAAKRRLLDSIGKIYAIQQEKHLDSRTQRVWDSLQKHQKKMRWIEYLDGSEVRELESLITLGISRMEENPSERMLSPGRQPRSKK